MKKAVERPTPSARPHSETPVADFGPAIMQWLLPDFYAEGPCQTLTADTTTEFRREYDDSGRLMRQDARGSQSFSTIFYYHPSGPLKEVLTGEDVPDKPGIRRAFHWDESGLATYVVVQEDAQPTPFVLDYSCSTSGLVLRCENRRAQASLRFEIDPRGRLVSVAEELKPHEAVTARRTYDEEGRLHSVERGRERREFVYKAGGTLVEIVDPDTAQPVGAVAACN
jgi:hypothetical protein